jgi:transcriptional regulator with XRE-family HTH domain
MPAPTEQIAAALRAERSRTGLSLSELAKRAGVAKSTLSQLEAGSGNPSVETLWALATALDVPFNSLVTAREPAVRLTRAGEGPVLASGQANYVVRLVSSSPPGARRDVCLIHAEPGEPKFSHPHQGNTDEHVIIVTGSAMAGPADEPVELFAGDSLTYPGDVRHVFEALEPHTKMINMLDYR